MHSIWFRGLNKEDKEDRVKELLSYRNAFDALKEILEEHYKEYTPDYDCPSWSHKQADVNGHNRAIKKVINLITIKEKQ